MIQHANQIIDIETASLRRLPIESHLAYLAGLVDGEGYIGIAKRQPTASNRNLTPKHTARLTIAMCERAPLEFFMEVMALPVGKFRLNSRPRRNPNARDSYSVDLENDHAAKVARLLAPLLLIKRRQALLIVELRELQLSHTRKERTEPSGVLQFKTGINAGHDYVLRKRSTSHLERCEELYQQCKTLNRKGRR